MQMLYFLKLDTCNLRAIYFFLNAGKVCNMHSLTMAKIC